MYESILSQLDKFLSFSTGKLLHTTEEGLMFYGSGEAAHWPVQSNLNVAAAFAIAGLAENDQNKIDIALKIFRYAFRTHLTGDLKCTCGKQWGRHWISVLGLERAAHAINALEKYFTADDLARYRDLRISESDFLLGYEVVAMMSGKEGKNKPESNIWNGGFLWRCALDYPEHPEAARWREKGTKLLLNGVSYITDAQCEDIYDGKPLREWHVGPNFTPAYSLDHHGYMNTGYSFVALSNMAMLHFNFKEKNQTPPAALYLHAADLWKTIKHFIFDDGRMLRIGGYNRSRYTYCQLYMIPVLFFAAEYLHDADAMRLAANAISICGFEQKYNNDGSFYSKRLEEIRKHSYYYYTRIESDPAVILSQCAYWLKKFDFPPVISGKQPDMVWSDDFHGAHLIKSSGVIRSFVHSTHRFSGPIALCIPADRSDMAEWHGNLSTKITMNRAGCTPVYSSGTQDENSFTHNSCVEWYNDLPLGEGEDKYLFCRNAVAVAALPDGKTLVSIEKSAAIKENMYEEIIPLNLPMPNDLFNGGVRKYSGENFEYESEMLPEKEISLDTGCRKLTIDGRLTIASLTPRKTLHIFKPARRSAPVIDKKDLTSLYIEYIATAAPEKFRLADKGEVLSDSAVALTVDAPDDFAADAICISEGNIRAVEITGTDGVRYRFIANIGLDETVFEGIVLPAGSSVLKMA